MMNHSNNSSGRRRQRERDHEEDGSTASSATGATGATGNTGMDSIKAVVHPPPRKRRRTGFEKSFQSISLRKPGDPQLDGDEDDADSSQAVAQGDVGEDVYSSSSSLDELDEPFLSDKEKAERQLMMELVFGHEAKDPVDAKLSVLIRHDMAEATKLEHQTSDDMMLDTVYNRPVAADADTTPMLPRSNSLPNLSMMDDDTMDTSSQL